MILVDTSVLIDFFKGNETGALLKNYLSSQRFFHPIDPVESYAEAARIYFLCRKKGITIRSTIDCLIAQICIEHELDLLHDDRDFDAMAEIVGLKCVTAF